jgi:hypothetical protein
MFIHIFRGCEIAESGLKWDFYRTRYRTNLGVFRSQFLELRWE